MTFNLPANAFTYYQGCLKFIKRVERKDHRKPDILEVEKFISETYGDGVLLSDSLKTIVILLMEEKISDSVFYGET